ncbi:MAG TPA: phosphate signaling complex protein PhoU [Gammaproteobacteria bacterium]|jgi:phosphate transport system protein
MKHYEQRLETDIANIRDHVDTQAASVSKAMKQSIHALLTGDEKLASEVIIADGPVNRAMRQIDAMCHSFIAVHLPSGRHLRLISSIIRINITLERIGDYAVTIARELVQLSEKPAGAIADVIEKLNDHAMGVFQQALESFKRDDADLAKQTMNLTQQTVTLFNDILDALVKEQEKRHVTDLFALFVVSHHLVRVSDQSKNICEDVVFAVTGETKAKKKYKVLFLDEDNSCLSQMAQAIGNKSYALGGEFYCAGKSPAAELHPGLADFMGQHGINMEGSKPKSIAALEHPLEDFHVVVSLKGTARSYMDNVPFHTALLEWDVGDVPSQESSDLCGQRLNDAYRDLALQIKDLMQLLRGDESPGS